MKKLELEKVQAPVFLTLDPTKREEFFSRVYSFVKTIKSKNTVKLQSEVDDVEKNIINYLHVIDHELGLLSITKFIKQQFYEKKLIPKKFDYFKGNMYE